MDCNRSQWHSANSVNCECEVREVLADRNDCLPVATTVADPGGHAVPALLGYLQCYALQIRMATLCNRNRNHSA